MFTRFRAHLQSSVNYRPRVRDVRSSNPGWNLKVRVPYICLVEIPCTRTASLKDYHGDLQKKFFFRYRFCVDSGDPRGTPNRFVWLVRALRIPRGIARLEIDMENESCEVGEPTTLGIKFSKIPFDPALALQFVVSFQCFYMTLYSLFCTSSWCRAH